MLEMWVQSLGPDDPLQKEMAHHAGKIPWTAEPGGPQSMGLQRVKHDCAHVQMKLICFVSYKTDMTYLTGLLR